MHERMSEWMNWPDSESGQPEEQKRKDHTFSRQFNKIHKYHTRLPSQLEPVPLVQKYLHTSILMKQNMCEWMIDCGNHCNSLEINVRLHS